MAIAAAAPRPQLGGSPGRRRPLEPNNQILFVAPISSACGDNSRLQSPTPATTCFDPEEKSTVLEEAEHWLLTTLREKMVKIGAKVVAHGRYVTFQLAEVAVPRKLFQKIFSLIDDLRRRPAPT